MKKAQVTIWVIVAVLLVVAVALFFLLRGKQGIEIFQPTMPEPQSYIEKCARDSTSEAINIMLPQAGYISPSNYKLYENNKVAYLCYTNKYYYSCINQQPMYIEFLEQEIKNYITGKLKDCFYNLKKEYQNRKYIVDDSAMTLEVELNPKQVEIFIEKKFEISRNEETRKFEKFKAKINSPLYDLAIIAQEITSQEAKFCYFEYLGFSLLYPSFEIEKNQVGSEEDVSNIYTIKDKVTGKELLIAIRSCAMPGGL